MASKTFGDEGKKRKTAANSAAGSGGQAEFRGYINLALSEEEKKAYSKWADPAAVFAVFAAAVSDGVNISVKPDVRGDGYMSSATQRRETSVNAGICVTARASDPVTSFGRLMYILSILSRAESWEATQPLANPDRW